MTVKGAQSAYFALGALEMVQIVMYFDISGIILIDYTI